MFQVWVVKKKFITWEADVYGSNVPLNTPYLIAAWIMFKSVVHHPDYSVVYLHLSGVMTPISLEKKGLCPKSGPATWQGIGGSPVGSRRQHDHDNLLEANIFWHPKTYHPMKGSVVL